MRRTEPDTDPDLDQTHVTQLSPATTHPAVDAAPVEASGQMSHREVLEALSGLLLAMFVAMLSSTVVTNALPRIVSDLHGSRPATPGSSWRRCSR